MIKKKLKTPFIIGEVGINHNGSVELAKEIISLAKQCNFDAVKLKSTKLFYVFFHDSIYGHSNEDNELLVYIPNHKKSRLSDMRIHSQNAQQKVFVSTLKKAMPKESQLKIEIQKKI